MSNHLFPLVYLLILFKLIVIGDCGIKCSKKVKISERVEMEELKKMSGQNGPIPKITLTKPIQEPNISSKSGAFVRCDVCIKLDKPLANEMAQLDDLNELSVDDNRDDSNAYKPTSKLAISKIKDSKSPKLIRFDKKDVSAIPSTSDTSVTIMADANAMIDETKTKDKIKIERRDSFDEIINSYKGSKSKPSPKTGISTNSKVKVNINSRIKPKNHVKKDFKKKN